MRAWDAPQVIVVAATAVMVVVGCRRKIRRGLPWAIAVLVTSCLLIWSKNDDTAVEFDDQSSIEDDDWVSLRYLL